MAPNKTISFNHKEELSLKIGREVPQNNVNLAYYEVPEIYPEEYIDIFNEAMNINSNLNTNIYSSDLYFANEQNVLHRLDNKESIILNKNFVLTDIAEVTGEEVYPYFYKYNLRYNHVNFNNTNISDNIAIYNQNKEKINYESFPYKINILSKSAINENQNRYQIVLYLAFIPNNGETFYVKYKPKELDIEEYYEIINPVPIFSETTIRNIFSHQNDVNSKLYAINNVINGKEIQVPIKASEIENPDIHNYHYQYDPFIPFNYEVVLNGYKKSELNGTMYCFVVDDSPTMSSCEVEVELAINNFIINLTNEQDGHDCKFRIVYTKTDPIWFLNPDINISPADVWADESYGLQCDLTVTSGNDCIYEGTNQAIDLFAGEEFLNYKKIIIVITNGNDYIGASSYEKLNQKAHNQGIDEIYVVGIGDNINPICLEKLADYNKYYYASTNTEIPTVFEDIYSKCNNRLVSIVRAENSGYVNNTDKYMEPQIDLTVPDNIVYSSAYFELKLNDTTGYVNAQFVGIKDGIETSYGNRIDLSSITDLSELGSVYVKAKSSLIKDLYTRLYYLKPKDIKGQIYCQLHVDDKNDNWYLKVKNGNFTTTNNGKTFVYGIPEYNYQDFDPILGCPYIKVQKEEAEKVDNKVIRVKNKPLYVEEITLANNYRVPSNINVVDQNGNTYQVIDWDITNGLLYLDKYINDNDLFVDYVYEQTWYDYKGYYDENGNFIHLDLNPRQGHTYTKKYYDSTIKEKPTLELYTNTIYLYLLPEYVIQENKIVKGTRNQATLFHTIGKALDENHPMVIDKIKSGLLNIEDIQLIAKIYINPVVNTNNLVILDSRERGGGIIIKSTEEDQFSWDIGKWDGEAYPANGVLVIELPKEVLETFNRKQIEEKIEKQLGYGILPIIKYV